MVHNTWNEPFQNTLVSNICSVEFSQNVRQSEVDLLENYVVVNFVQNVNI